MPVTCCSFFFFLECMFSLECTLKTVVCVAACVTKIMRGDPSVKKHFKIEQSGCVQKKSALKKHTCACAKQPALKIRKVTGTTGVLCGAFQTSSNAKCRKKL